MPRPSEELLVDGYISTAFYPKSAEEYFSHLLKNKNWKELYSIFPSPSGSNMVFVVREASPLLQPPPFMRGRNGVPLDYVIDNIGTVVPQTWWTPHNANDFRQHVEEAELQLPIFFIHENGNLGLSLNDAAHGRCRTLRDADTQAQLGGKTTTHIRIWWSGYKDFKRQVQIRDETAARNPITVGKFVHHIGRSVEAFLNSPVSKEMLSPSEQRWRIGPDGINRASIRVIGAVHVSAGSWMPILQLNSYVI
ncbi:hypothetical protein BJY52DRAFT_831821 [Lactarius psammicola]|nr:hypothetical protein BJY52DRAFT_831821 [Lactarius psammicola]